MNGIMSCMDHFPCRRGPDSIQTTLYTGIEVVGKSVPSQAVLSHDGWADVCSTASAGAITTIAVPRATSVRRRPRTVAVASTSHEVGVLAGSSHSTSRHVTASPLVLCLALLVSACNQEHSSTVYCSTGDGTDSNTNRGRPDGRC